MTPALPPSESPKILPPVANTGRRPSVRSPCPRSASGRCPNFARPHAVRHAQFRARYPTFGSQIGNDQSPQAALPKKSRANGTIETDCDR